MPESGSQLVTAARVVDASAQAIFELIAEPANQPRWDGNENLSHAESGQRVTGVGDTFFMTNTHGKVRANHVVEFIEGRRIAWKPSGVNDETWPGHLWRWIIEPIDENHSKVTHEYDWSELTDEKRLAKARATTADMLTASLNQLATLAESLSSDTEG